MTVALETRNLVKRFGGFTATNDVSLTIESGARHALIGPNGAGKTTLINLLTGVLKPTSGQVIVDGEDITGLSSHRRVRRGIARTFQINQLFSGFTPLESVLLAINERDGFGRSAWRPLAAHLDAIDEAVDLLERFGLSGVMGEKTGRIAYGKQRLLEIALAFASRPRVLLLDEPAAGVAEEERSEVLAIVRSLPAEVTVVLIEHDMDLVFSFADRISVLVAGAVMVEGTVGEIAADPRVKAVYLGEDAT
ncbi:ABC transporter ATP-binding protein [Rhizobium johnstonii]|uniref:ABC transporter ATP-binding protein n=1 Tax=Rhizobium TaxID=379 RepID=UPI00103011B8|nr:ABC transporter ATP-binding protein [Rhizobium leguminosarum]MBY5392012.1 ABC transporter ATP-binding protein [Rhizobium leguminosarum]MBY5432183.1 ABC transporter ATP-binding protein [Rhizobium leguminosarum]NEI02327.1 ATP-binding cassette domain-containing protein [Rhizobium leguminosarum]NEJ47048.1 ATP-binding cassette domain-containing protein [Rhizobium leguminosarum]NEJ53976.1 ATP-binding cassette domain-containing protein [Rhizobium leguminosarum]